MTYTTIDRFDDIKKITYQKNSFDYNGQTYEFEITHYDWKTEQDIENNNQVRIETIIAQIPQ